MPWLTEKYLDGTPSPSPRALHVKHKKRNKRMNTSANNNRDPGPNATKVVSQKPWEPAGKAKSSSARGAKRKALPLPSASPDASDSESSPEPDVGFPNPQTPPPKKKKADGPMATLGTLGSNHEVVAGQSNPLIDVIDVLDPRVNYITRIQNGYEGVYQTARLMPRVLGPFIKVEQAFTQGSALAADPDICHDPCRNSGATSKEFR
ncbi:hypothetical protein BD413DRAFT_612098 [Trametes elegans]|nr:hypothetical protein BD413DRAFT_612098 [Trametes elegans]